MTKQSEREFLRTKQASDYSGIEAKLLPHLKLAGIVASIQEPDGLVAYSKVSLDLARILIPVANRYGWRNYNTLAWYNDLLFACEIGRAVIQSDIALASPTEPWINGRFASDIANAVIRHLTGDATFYHVQIADYLRALYVFVWKKPAAIEGTTVFPLIISLEEAGHQIIDNTEAIARDGWALFSSILYTFRSSAMAGSIQLRQIVSTAHSQMDLLRSEIPPTPPDEIDKISRDSRVAIDRLYASKATEIHTPAEEWEHKLGVVRAYRRTIAVEIQVPDGHVDVSTAGFIDNLIDLVRPFLGSFGARVVHQLYTIANDPPNWRNPYITIDTNLLLDSLGLKRDERGYHRSKNRERLRDTLNAAHALEIVGEFSTTENGESVTKVFRRTVLSILSASYDPAERGDMNIFELLEKGLPKTANLRLNFYDGVRQQNGKLGTNYVLMPRLGAQMKAANHAGTSELLKAYLATRSRQTHSRAIRIARATALEQANIKMRNVTDATRSLTKALSRLIDEGFVESFTAIPTKPSEAFIITLQEIK